MDVYPISFFIKKHHMDYIKEKQNVIINWIRSVDLNGYPQLIIDLINEDMYLLATTDDDICTSHYLEKWGALSYRIVNIIDVASLENIPILESVKDCCTDMCKAIKRAIICKEEEDMDQDKLDSLVNKVEQWCIDRNLHTQDPKVQMCKTMEELGELASGICKDDRDKQIYSIGDVMVTIICLAKQLDLSLYECLDYAYNEIKDRKGKLIDGVFVKESDIK